MAGGDNIVQGGTMLAFVQRLLLKNVMGSMNWTGCGGGRVQI